MRKKSAFLLCALVLVNAAALFSQSVTAADVLVRLKGGINLYTQGKWDESLIELRWAASESPSKAQSLEALYWISLAEFSSGNYDESLRVINALQELNPRGIRARELPYHKGRALYYLGRYEESIAALTDYSNSLSGGKDGAGSVRAGLNKAAALYWIGECLYSMGQTERASEIFTHITEEYPASHKYEASLYRAELLKQKKVEEELLELLEKAHAESIKNEDRIRALENELASALKTGPLVSSAEVTPAPRTKSRDEETSARLRVLRDSALELSEEIQKSGAERSGGRQDK